MDSRYFITTPHGRTVQIPAHMVQCDSSGKLIGTSVPGGRLLPVRWIRVAAKSSHKCDARCETATGHDCQCACGGKNHGIAA